MARLRSRRLERSEHGNRDIGHQVAELVLVEDFTGDFATGPDGFHDFQTSVGFDLRPEFLRRNSVRQPGRYGSHPVSRLEFRRCGGEPEAALSDHPLFLTF